MGPVLLHDAQAAIRIVYIGTPCAHIVFFKVVTQCVQLPLFVPFMPIPPAWGPCSFWQEFVQVCNDSVLLLGSVHFLLILVTVGHRSILHLVHFHCQGNGQVDWTLFEQLDQYFILDLLFRDFLQFLNVEDYLAHGHMVKSGDLVVLLGLEFLLFLKLSQHQVGIFLFFFLHRLQILYLTVRIEYLTV